MDSWWTDADSSFPLTSSLKVDEMCTVSFERKIDFFLRKISDVSGNALNLKIIENIK